MKKNNIDKTFIIDEIISSSESVDIVDSSDIDIIDGCKVYHINSDIDLGDKPINVTEKGVILIGYDKNMCGLYSSSDNYTMFIKDESAEYTGKIILKNLSIGVDGENSSIFDLDNKESDNNTDNFIEWVDVNYVFNNSLGIIKSYRQGLWDNGAAINNGTGLTLDGTWGGGFRTNLIRIINNSSKPFFIAGPTLKFNGRFFSNTFYTSINTGSTFCDFSEDNIINDGDLQIINGDFGGGKYDIESYFPNFNISSTKAFFDSFGLPKTNVGGELNFTNDTEITFSATNEYMNIISGTTLEDGIWFNLVDNGIQYKSDVSSSFLIDCVVNIDAIVNDTIGVTLFFWDDSENSFVKLEESIKNVPFIGVVTFNLIYNLELSKNDTIGLLVKNVNDSSNINILSDSKINVLRK